MTSTARLGSDENGETRLFDEWMPWMYEMGEGENDNSPNSMGGKTKNKEREGWDYTSQNRTKVSQEEMANGERTYNKGVPSRKSDVEEEWKGNERSAGWTSKGAHNGENNGYVQGGSTHTKTGGVVATRPPYNYVAANPYKTIIRGRNNPYREGGTTDESIPTKTGGVGESPPRYHYVAINPYQPVKRDEEN